MNPRLTIGLPLLIAMSSTVAVDTLPAEPSYIGKIARDSQGRLVAVPEDARQKESARLPAPEGSAIPPPAASNVGFSASRGLPSQVKIGTPSVIRVGPSQTVLSISAAAKLAKDGDTVEIDAGDYHADVALWTQDRLTIRAVGGMARLFADGANIEGKAIWVIRGGRVTVENIEFQGARVPDRNGAGIRFEKGQLTVRNCRFIDNEDGMLTAGGDAELVIENSEFAHNGSSREGYTHNLYVGDLRKLTVTGSYFHHGKGGQLIKSRARENFVLYNRITDEAGGLGNYELEFSNGGIAYVIGNIIQQSAGTTNSIIVSFGPEGYKHPVNELYFVNNTLDDRHPCCGIFLFVRPGAKVRAYNNLLIGKGPFAKGIDGAFANNPNVDWEPFVLAQRHDYRIKREGRLERTWVPPGVANGIDLTPTREYIHPRSTRTLTGPPSMPGARQTLEPDAASK